MPLPGPPPSELGDRLVGWKDIAAHLKVSRRTAVRWADGYGLPVQRMARGARPLVFAQVDALDHWWGSAAAVQARQERTPGDLVGTDPENAVDSGVPSSTVGIQLSLAGNGERYRGPTITKVGVWVGVTLIAIAATWGVETWRASPQGRTLTLASRLADGAHGESVSNQLVELRLTVTGRSEATIQVAEGEMARIETVKTKLGLQARQVGDRLALLAYRLDTIGSGESATSIGSFTLDPRSQAAQVDVNGERAAVAWSGPLRVAPRRSASLEPCCMVCKGVTFCGQVVSANCGSCRGNEVAGHDKAR